MEVFRLLGSVIIQDDGAEKKLDGIEKKTTGLADKLGGLGKGIGNVGGKMTAWVTGPLVGAGIALFGLATKAGNAADRILDLNAITGMSTGSIQEWQNVAKVAGVETEAVTSAAEKLTRQLYSMEDGSGKGAEALAALGISFTDLEAMSPDERMETVIASLAGIESPAERAKLGTDLLAGSWADIAPIVAMGTDEIDKARQAAHDMGAVMSEQALNDANDFRIGMQNLKTEFGALLNEIGAKFAPLLTDTLIPLFQNQVMPVIEKAIQKVSKLADWFMGLDEGTQKTILTITGLVIAIGPALAIISKTIAIVQSLTVVVGLLGKALMFLSANPVGLVIMAIGLLVAAGILLYKNWDDVKQWILNIWDSIKNAAVTVFNWLADFFKEWGLIILAGLTGPVGLSVALIIKYWDEIKEAATKIFTAISNFVSDIWNGMTGNIKGAINVIIGSINKFIGALNRMKIRIPPVSVPILGEIFGGAEIGLPKIPEIPMLAKGGTITGAGRVLVGEDGPEFLDLPKGASVKPLDKSGGTSGPLVVINHPKIFSMRDVNDMGKALVDHLRTMGIKP